MQQQTRMRLITRNAEDSPEFQEFRSWAKEPGPLMPFMTLAFQWFAGLLTVEEGRRIETDQELAQLLQT